MEVLVRDRETEETDTDWLRTVILTLIFLITLFPYSEPDLALLLLLGRGMLVPLLPPPPRVVHNAVSNLTWLLPKLADRDWPWLCGHLRIYNFPTASRFRLSTKVNRFWLSTYISCLYPRMSVLLYTQLEYFVSQILDWRLYQSPICNTTKIGTYKGENERIHYNWKQTRRM